MLRLLMSAVLGIALAGGTAPVAQAQKDAKKEAKDAGIKGKVRSVNMEKSTVTITADDGKERTFLIKADTKIVGPRGGVSAERLKDDRFMKGSEITIIPSKDGKSAAEVRLGFRKKDEKKGGK